MIEILIVVIILGILAAIVLPQFTNASQDARQNSVRSVVQSMRSQVGLFALQHGDSLPDSSSTANFWASLTGVTTYGGARFGPYLQSVPINPWNQSSAVATTTGGSSAGWALMNSHFYGYTNYSNTPSWLGDN